MKADLGNTIRCAIIIGGEDRGLTLKKKKLCQKKGTTAQGHVRLAQYGDKYGPGKKLTTGCKGKRLSKRLGETIQADHCKGQAIRRPNDHEIERSC